MNTRDEVLSLAAACGLGAREQLPTTEPERSTILAGACSPQQGDWDAFNDLLPPADDDSADGLQDARTEMERLFSDTYRAWMCDEHGTVAAHIQALWDAFNDIQAR